MKQDKPVGPVTGTMLVLNKMLDDKARIYIQAVWEEDAPDVHNPYDGDYLPLDLWDQTPD